MKPSSSLRNPNQLVLLKSNSSLSLSLSLQRGARRVNTTSVREYSAAPDLLMKNPKRISRDSPLRVKKLAERRRKARQRIMVFFANARDGVERHLSPPSSSLKRTDAFQARRMSQRRMGGEREGRTGNWLPKVRPSFDRSKRKKNTIKKQGFL